MRDIQSRMNASRVSTVPSGFAGGAPQDASVTVEPELFGSAGDADAVLVAVAISNVSADETTSARTRFDCMVPPEVPALAILS
jgi:hypothetical protein